LLPLLHSNVNRRLPTAGGVSSVSLEKIADERIVLVETAKKQ
jgi:hypothetical protein